MGEELILKIRETDNVIEVGIEVVTEALNHLTDFNRGRDVWQRDIVKRTCYRIGESIFDKSGITGMRDVYHGVRYEMGPIAARYLEQFWADAGHGYWL